MIDGTVYPSEEKLIFEKKRARSGLIFSVANNLIAIVVDKLDLVDSWQML